MSKKNECTNDHVVVYLIAILPNNSWVSVSYERLCHPPTMATFSYNDRLNNNLSEPLSFLLLFHSCCVFVVKSCKNWGETASPQSWFFHDYSYPPWVLLNLSGFSNIAAAHNSTLINSQPDGNSCLLMKEMVCFTQCGLMVKRAALLQCSGKRGMLIILKGLQFVGSSHGNSSHTMVAF